MSKLLSGNPPPPTAALSQFGQLWGFDRSAGQMMNYKLDGGGSLRSVAWWVVGMMAGYDAPVMGKFCVILGAGKSGWAP